MEHRLVGVGRTCLVLVQLFFGRVGTDGVVWSALGTLLGPEGSGFGLSLQRLGLPFGGPARADRLPVVPLVPALVGVGLAPVWGRSPPVA